MNLPICQTCGVQYDEAHFDPDHCKICEDERQYVGWDGQRWTTLEGLTKAGHRGVVKEEDAELVGVGTEPSVGIGQRALLVPGKGGNVLWDCVPCLDDTVAAEIITTGISRNAISDLRLCSTS